MKRNTLEHPKVRRLARALGVERWGAIGVLESLWCWTGRYCPNGAIGTFDDEELADAIGWNRDAGELVRALVATGWLDEHAEYRLLIHDWADHADDATRKALERTKACFATGESPRSRQSRDSVAPTARLPVPGSGPGRREEKKTSRNNGATKARQRRAKQPVRFPVGPDGLRALLRSPDDLEQIAAAALAAEIDADGAAWFICSKYPVIANGHNGKAYTDLKATALNWIGRASAGELEAAREAGLRGKFDDYFRLPPGQQEDETP